MASNDINDDIIVSTTTLILTCAEEIESKKKRERRPKISWVKPWLACRESMGACQALVREFANNEHDEY